MILNIWKKPFLFIFKVSAHLNLKGLVDPAKEKEKLEKKKVTLEAQVDKLKKLTAVKGIK